MSFFKPPSCFEVPQVCENHTSELDIDDEKCPECCVMYQLKDAQTKVCPQCGVEIDFESENSLYTHDATHSYNCGSSSHMPFKVNGVTKSAMLQNSLMKRVSDYETLKRRKIYNKIMKWVVQVPDECVSIPISIVNETVNAYCELQEENKLVKRAGGLDSVLAFIIHNKCSHAGTPRDYKHIVKLAGIQDSQLSAGERAIDKLKDQTIIEDVVKDECVDYVEVFFEKLGIECNDRYKGFVVDLVRNSRLEKINTKDNTSIMTTRCIGSIYILSTQLKLGVPKEDFEVKCSIAKGTFMRFVSMISTHMEKKCIKKVFAKYDIPPL